MKVIVAIDSFKGSLSSIEAGNIIKEAIENVCDDEVTVHPLADGGEGTIEALISGMGGEGVEVETTGPLGDKIISKYGIVKSKQLAIIEMASTAGITLVPYSKRNPMNTTTFGVGELILDAVEKGCREFVIGIGGSATNDGGMGMMQALGARFIDAYGSELGPFGRDMLKISSVCLDHLNPVLKECKFRVACDVNNPLCGPLGASVVYGPQKGATPQIIEMMNCGLERYANIIKSTLGQEINYANLEGVGAAGGLGYAFLSFLNAELRSGIELILDVIDLEGKIKDADIVITGEGKLDFQTSMGKAPIGVAKLGKKYGAKVLAFAGGTTEDAAECNKKGIDAYFSIMQVPMLVDEAMKPEISLKNLKATVMQVFRLIHMDE